MHAYKEENNCLSKCWTNWILKIKYYKEDFSHGSLINVLFFSLLQLIQTISAVDKDDPLGGQKFFFSLAAVNPNFTVQDNEGKFWNVLIMI